MLHSCCDTVVILYFVVLADAPDIQEGLIEGMPSTLCLLRAAPRERYFSNPGGSLTFLVVYFSNNNGGQLDLENCRSPFPGVASPSFGCVLDVMSCSAYCRGLSCACL